MHLSSSLCKVCDVSFHMLSLTFTEPAYLTFRPVLNYRALIIPVPLTSYSILSTLNKYEAVVKLKPEKKKKIQT